MKAWISELERALSKHFYQEEVDDIVAYYQEFFEERMANGESFDDIAQSYPIDTIIKSMRPVVLLKRKNDTYSKQAKSMRQLFYVLWSTPLLIPLGIVYLILMIISLSLVISIMGITFSGIVALAALVFDVLGTQLGTAESFAIIGTSMVALGVAALASSLVLGVVWQMSKWIYRWFIKIIRKGENNEMDI